ncbi:MAG: carbohydrate kinase family protein [Actinomycetaceae bacterium]|nr:carbohydrate kinase family protein [Actinomycetaceae bacterium]
MDSDSKKAPEIPEIVVCGPTFMDVVMAGLPGAPRLGEEMWVGDSTVTAGGAANQATAIARLGVPCELVTKLGTDRAGQIVRDVLAENNVKTTYATPVPHQSITVSMSWNDDRAMVTHGSDEGGTLPADFTPAVLVADLKAIAANEDVVKSWRSRGTKVIGDVGWDDTGAWRIEDLEPLEHCDYFVPNETEFLHYARTYDLRQAMSTISEFVDTDATFVLTRGARGVAIMKDDKHTTLPAMPVKVVDPTGAGDSFSAGLAAGVAMGADPKAAISLGLIVAGLSLTKPGGAGATPTIGELPILLKVMDVPNSYDLGAVEQLLTAHNFDIPL